MRLYLRRMETVTVLGGGQERSHATSVLYPIPEGTGGYGNRLLLSAEI